MTTNHNQAPSEYDVDLDDRERELLVDQGVMNNHEATLRVHGFDKQPDDEAVPKSSRSNSTSQVSSHRKPRGTSYPEPDDPDFRVPTFVERTPEEKDELARNIGNAILVARDLEDERMIDADPAEIRHQRALRRARDERRHR